MSGIQNIPRIEAARAILGEYFSAGRRIAHSQYASFLAHIPSFSDVVAKGGQTTRGLAPYKFQLLAAGGIIGTAAAVVAYVLTRPEYPNFHVEFSQEVAKVKIYVPEKKRQPISVCFTFVVDESGSMEGDRITQVKNGLIKILNSAVEEIEKNKGTTIKLAIVKFQRKAELVQEVFQVIGGDEQAIKVVKNKILSIGSEYGTIFDCGLSLGVSSLVEIAKTDRSAKQVFVLLTDGQEENYEVLNDEKLKKYHEQLADVNAQVYAIGIGKEHDKKYIKKIAGSGKYIDTTKDGVTIENTLAKIYKRSIGKFTNLSLTISNLNSKLWTVSSSQEDEVLSEGKEVTKYIQVHRRKFEDSFDLNRLWVRLDFTDPNGRKGTIWERWNASSIVQPELLREACGGVKIL